MKPIFRPFRFREYIHESNRCPIKIVTPPGGNYIHTFFDLNPISPSGRYLACIKLPFTDRLPTHEDSAVVCIVDLFEESIAEVYETRGFGLCVGAHVCWGGDDNQLYFNDKQDDCVFSVEYHLEDGSFRKLNGSIYQVTKDNKYAFSPNLAIANHAQKGYGVVLDDSKYNTMPTDVMSDDEGLWRLDIERNVNELIYSKKDAYDLMPDKKPFDGSRMVFFHTKISPDQKRVMQMIRCTRDGVDGQIRCIITMDTDGGNPCLALPYEFWIGNSHHPDWHPNSQEITMNIRLNDVLRFYQFRQDGSSLHMIFPHLTGSGHPSFSKDLRFLLSDAYTDEPLTNKKGEVPIRLIDSATGIDNPICYIWSLSSDTLFDLRRDPHPVWNSDCTKVTFNGVIGDNHQILVADVSKLVGGRQ